VTKVKVKTFSVIRDVLGAEVVEVVVDDPATVDGVFKTLVKKYGQPFREKLWDTDTGQMAPFLMRLNDEMISSTFDMNREVKEGDEIAVIFPVGGG
jgi:MoaD family protein